MTKCKDTNKNVAPCSPNNKYVNFMLLARDGYIELELAKQLKDYQDNGADVYYDYEDNTWSADFKPL